MKRKLHQVWTGTGLALALACSVLSCTPNLARRYKNWSEPKYRWVDYRGAQRYCTVDLSSLTVVSPDAAPAVKLRKDVTNLAPSAQVALIGALSKATGIKTDELLTKLGEAFADPAYVESNRFKASTPKELPPINQTRVIPKKILKQLNIASRKNAVLADDADDAASFNGVTDHLVMLELEMGIDTTQAVFSSWDSFETIYGVIDLGKVTSSQELSMSATISAKAGGSASLSNAGGNEYTTSATQSDKATQATGTTTGVTSATSAGTDERNTQVQTTQTSAQDGTTAAKEKSRASNGKKTSQTGNSASTSYDVGPSASVGYKGNYATEDSPTERILLFSGILQPQRILVKQTGAKGRYIEGNNKVLVECEVKADWAPPILITKLVGNLYDKQHAPIALPKLKLERTLVLFPDVKADILVLYKYNFLHRSVLGGSRHLPEARHRVEFWHGRVGYQKAGGEYPPDEQKATVLTKADFRPKTYRVSLGTGTTNDLVLNGTKLNFDTPKEALDFIEYLLRLADQGVVSFPTPVLTTTGALTKSDLPRLLVRTVRN